MDVPLNKINPHESMTNMAKIERGNQGSQIQHIIQTKVMQSGTFFRYIYIVLVGEHAIQQESFLLSCQD